MRSQLLWVFVIIEVLCFCNESGGLVLQPGEVQQIQVSAHSMTTLTVEDVPSSVAIVLFQVHTHTATLTLSLDPVYVISRYTNGLDIGILAELPVGADQASCYVWCTICLPDRNETVLVMASYLTSTDPVPGACNMEFSLEEDPNVNVPYDKYINPVQFQFANFGKQRDKLWQSCESKTLQSKLTYDVYQMFLPPGESSERQFLHSMTIILNQTQLFQKAKKIETVHYGSGKPEALFAAYYGQGVAYAIVVSQNAAPLPAASTSYVPVVMYNCQYTADGSCDMKTPGIVTLKVVSTLLAVVGAVLCFVGHRIFKTSMFVFGWLAFTLIFLILILRFAPWSLMTSLLTSVGLGAVGGVLWLAVWCFLGLPVLSVLLPGLVFGYLVASVLFVTSPLDDLEALQSTFNYGMCFACAVLVPCVLLLIFSRVLHIAACTVVGSFLVIHAFDRFTHGNLQRILSTSLKKSLSDRYLHIHNTWPEFSVSDMILSASWAVLCVCGAVFQYRRERGRPHFPPCPYRVYKHNRAYRRMPGLEERTAATAPSTERDPLLHHEHGRVAAAANDDYDDSFETIIPSPALLHTRPLFGSSADYGSTDQSRRMYRGQHRTRSINDVSGFYEEEEEDSPPLR